MPDTFYNNIFKIVFFYVLIFSRHLHLQKYNALLVCHFLLILVVLMSRQRVLNENNDIQHAEIAYKHCHMTYVVLIVDLYSQGIRHNRCLFTNCISLGHRKKLKFYLHCDR